MQEIDLYTKRAYNKNQIYTLSKYTRLIYRAIGTSIKYRSGFYGDGLLSRFPIEYSANFLSPLIHKTSEQRGILSNKISFGTTKLNFFSVHLSTFKDERIAACKELLKISSKINKGEGIIIAGDFNVGISKLGSHKYSFKPEEEYPEYKILKEKFHHINNSDHTWFDGVQSACIDTMFYSKNLSLSKFETIETEVSDHYPVYAEFII